MRDAGHATLSKQPARYLSVLKKFLESVEGRPL
jgi:hypothetical protein